MNCRVLTAALVLMATAACGGPDVSDPGNYAAASAGLAGATTVASSQDPVPAQPKPTAAPTLSPDDNPLLFLVLAPVVTPPDVTSSQDPIPARIDMPVPSNDPVGPTAPQAETDGRGRAVAK